MKSMQAVRAKSASPTSRGLRLPFPCSEIVDLTQDDEDKYGEASQAMLKSWRSLLRCELATCVCFVRAYTCVFVCVFGYNGYNGG